MPNATIIIPTYDRTASLLRTLESLQAQDLVDFEIIVADNACQPTLRQAIQGFNRTARVPAKYFANPSGDNASGRNLGAAAASSELLVYTDDDLTFPADWLRAYCEAFAAHPEMAAAGGRVTPVWEQAPPDWLLDFMGDAENFGVLALMHPHPEFSLGPDGYFYSCNMAVRRGVFAYTSFHPELYGWRTVGDGEAGMNLDMQARGELIGYVPTAQALHHITVGRLTLGYVMRWAGHLAGNQMYRRCLNRRRTPALFLGELKHILRTFTRYWVRYPVVRGHTAPRRAVEIQFNAARGWQHLCYLGRMLYEADLQKALDITDFSLQARYPGPAPTLACEGVATP